MSSRRPPVPKGSAPKNSSQRAGATAGANETQKPSRAVKPELKQGKAEHAAKTAKSKAPAEPVAAKSFSGRLLVLIVVLLAVTVMLAPSVNTYLQQRSEISALKADIAAKKQEQQNLQNNLSQWSDPAYIKQQARDRVSMMMPGETGYWVYGGEGTPAAPEQVSTSANPEGLPWVAGLWQSITRAANE